MTGSDELNKQVDLAKAVLQIAQRFALESPVDIKKLSSGVMTYKYVISCMNGSRWVVRFYPKGREDVVSFEPDLLRRCGIEGGMAVPEVLGDSQEDPAAPLPYVVYRMIPGVSLTERIGKMHDTTLLALAKQVVDSLCRMGEIPIEGWGELADAWHGRSPSWAAFLAQTCEEGIVSNKKGILSNDRMDQLCSVCEGITVFAPPPNPGLALGDLSSDNIIVNDKGVLCGFVDFESTLIADPLLSLGYLCARDPQSRFYQALVAAWPGGVDTSTRKRVDLYAVVRLLRILKYATQPLPTGLPRMPLDVFFPGAMHALVTLADS
jgi:aminoglycoside phosphotransferase (APT) family kinase protein